MRRPTFREFALVAVCWLLGLLFLIPARDVLLHPGPSGNLYVYQARAFLDGHLYINGYMFDCAEFKGKVYVPFPPAPALLLTPFVALFGVDRCNPSLVAMALSGLNVLLFLRLMKSQGLSLDSSLWLAAAFFLGTGYWLAAIGSGGVWFFAHVCAVTCLLVALAETFGRARGWLVGLALAGAILSRQFTVILGLFFLAMLWERSKAVGGGRRARLLGFVLVVGAAVGIYCFYNYARFGDPLDTGYAYLRREGFVLHRFKKHGTFSLAYLPFNIIYLIFEGFHADFTSRTQLGKMVMNPFGTGLLHASPVILLAFFAKQKKLISWATVVTFTAIIFGHGCYYLNGFAQTNTQRFTLDFLPVLFLFVAWGMRREVASGRATLWKFFIGYAILLNFISLVALETLNVWLERLG